MSRMMVMAAIFELFGERAKPAPAAVHALRMEHAPDCARIHAQSFSRGWSAEDFQALLADPATCADAASIGSPRRLLGFAVSRIAADQAEILTIAVDAAARRRGAGRALLQAHLAHLAERRARSLFLEVDAQNAAALALYARFGFRQVGERRAYYARADGSRANALILRRELG